MFHICERQGSVVSIYVDLLGGESACCGPTNHEKGVVGTRRGITVWFVFEHLRSRWRAAVPMNDNATARKSHVSFTGPGGATPYDIILDLGDYRESRPTVADNLMLQVCDISSRSFDENVIREWAKLNGKVLSVLADAAYNNVFGYSLLSRMATLDFYVEQFA